VDFTYKIEIKFVKRFGNGNVMRMEEWDYSEWKSGTTPIYYTFYTEYKKFSIVVAACETKALQTF
jgi:hypothetical protein